MSRRKLNDWKAYFELEPWGGTRGDIAVGMLACFIETMFVGRDEARLNPAQFIYKSEDPEVRELREAADEVYRQYLLTISAEADITPTN